MTVSRPHTIHRRFYNSNRQLKRVVSVRYTVDTETGVLRYGATVYKRNSENPPRTEQWNRSMHYERAVERYFTNPVLIQFGQIEEFPRHWEFRRLENLIIEKLIYHHGVEGSEDMKKGTLPDYTALTHDIFDHYEDSIERDEHEMRRRRRNRHRDDSEEESEYDSESSRSDDDDDDEENMLCDDCRRELNTLRLVVSSSESTVNNQIYLGVIVVLMALNLLMPSAMMMSCPYSYYY